MAFYPPKVDQRFASARFAGRTPGANGVGTAASFECGCFVRLSLAVESETKIIRRASFETNGCGFMTAAADLAAELLTAAALTDLNSLVENDFTASVEGGIGRLPPGRSQCVRVVLEAVRNALADYRAFAVEEFRGEKALICTCFGISEETIEAYIAEASPVSVDDVTDTCRAGGGCGSCRMLIQEMLDQAGR